MRLIGLVVLVTFNLVLTPPAGGAQQANKVYRIGCLMLTPRAATDVAAALSAALAEVGYVEGRNLTIDWRSADTNPGRLSQLAQDLVRLNVDLIVAISNEAISATKESTSTIPIVMVGASNPVEAGLVTSLPRPGGNVTGTTYTPPEVAGKLVEVLKEAVPRISRVTIIWNPSMPGMSVYTAHADRAAQALGVALHYLDVRRPADLTVDKIVLSRPDALYVVPDPIVSSGQAKVIRLALERKLPSIGTGRLFVEAGGLLYYGLDRRNMWQRTAVYVDRIFKGAKPADLPVEQPTKFELVINLKTAKALGLTIPQTLLLRADQVIE
jgi:ABC-type uncharacterized transport system substrate-binding protein